MHKTKGEQVNDVGMNSFEEKLQNIGVWCVRRASKGSARETTLSMLRRKLRALERMVDSPEVQSGSHILRLSKEDEV